MTPKITLIDKQVCVCESYAMYDEPTQITHHWPIGVGAHWAREHIGKEVRKSTTAVYLLCIGPWQHITLRLVDEERTQAIKMEETPIPCPKCRVETRYRFGHWEKYLKSDGWVRA